MQYMVLIHVDEAQQADYGKISPEYVSYVQELEDAGVVRHGNRLMPTSTATIVRVREGEELITDGPFAEAREQIGGYFVFDCADLDEALKWAARCPGARTGAIEVRPLAH